MNEKVPKKLQARFEEITSLTDAVCRQYLNDEYAELSRKMAAALARKRPSPLQSGRANTWACGIVYTIGFVNFLFDKSFPPYMSAEETISVNGLIIDARYAPRYIQEEAYRKGLIPYLPGEVDPSPSQQGEPAFPFKVGNPSQ